MWLIKIRESDKEFRRVFWLDNDYEGQRLITKDVCARCTGPDGITFNEAAPEDMVVATLKEAENWQIRKKEFTRRGVK